MAIKQRSKSLKSRQSNLSDTMFQLDVLNNAQAIGSDFVPFEHKLLQNGIEGVVSTGIDIFQINVGKQCNQSCAHCHVDAGPDRTEEMSKSDLQICFDIIRDNGIKTVDITGGAPEMNPHFRWFVEQCSSLDVTIIDRCNLTIIEANPKYHDLPEFFAKHKVQVISSLPHYNKKRTDSQRGDGVFDDSIKALKRLNRVGYGLQDSGLILDLVYNPTGTFLPSDQAQLESEFKYQMKQKYDIEFNSLYAITNLPISRFLDYLIDNELYSEYMHRLIDAFNPATVEGLMCRNTISVSWDGYLYDCDFNQMLDVHVASHSRHISEFDFKSLENRKIVLNQHCYGCTAGAGSSCGGEIV